MATLAEIIKMMMDALAAQAAESAAAGETLDVALVKAFTTGNITTLQAAITGGLINIDNIKAMIAQADAQQKTIADLTHINFPAPPELSRESPVDPGKEMMNKIKYFRQVEEQLGGAFNRVAWASFVPFVNATGYTQALLQKPETQALYQQDVDFNSLTYNYAQKPALIRSIRHAARTEIPEPYRLASQYAKGLISYQRYTSTMGQDGFEEEWSKSWALDNAAYPTPDVALVMLRRNIIDRNDFETILRRNSFESVMVEKYAQLKDVIPPLDDLIRFAVREAYLDHEPEKQYPAYEALAAKMGLTPEKASWYWYAHWSRIAINLMYENLYRGYWNKDKLAYYLKLADIHPDDRQAIIDVAFQPPSIREMGYGYDVGAYNKEDIIKYRRWGGLSPEDADKAGTAMVAYRTEAERNAVRTEYMYLYGLGKISRDELVDHITDIGTAPEAIPLWLERADLYKIRIHKEAASTEPKAITRSDAQWMFENDLRTEQWFKAQLTDLGYDDNSIETYTAQSKLRIQKAIAKVEEPPAKALSLAQITDLYTAKLIDDRGMQLLIGELDYSTEDTKTLTKLIIHQVETSTIPLELNRSDAINMYDFRWFTIKELYTEFKRLRYSDFAAKALTQWVRVSSALPELKSRYSKGWITSADLYQALLNMEVPIARANEIMQTIVKSTQQERLAPERDLTKAEIIKGAKSGVITTNDAVQLLQELGYEQWEAYYLLEINKVVAAGDPEGYWEMRRVVEAYKKARGEKSIDIPQELIILERQQHQIRQEIEQAKKDGKSAEEIAQIALTLTTVSGRIVAITTKLGIK